MLILNISKQSNTKRNNVAPLAPDLAQTSILRHLWIWANENTLANALINRRPGPKMPFHKADLTKRKMQSIRSWQLGNSQIPKLAKPTKQNAPRSKALEIICFCIVLIICHTCLFDCVFYWIVLVCVHTCLFDIYLFCIVLVLFIYCCLKSCFVVSLSLLFIHVC